jgi:hypothetical protein
MESVESNNIFPDDVIIHIFSFLKFDEVFRLNTVCSQWRRVGWPTELSMTLANLNSKVLKQVITKSKYMRVFNGSACPEITKSVFQQICKQWKHLEVLDISSCMHLRDSALESLQELKLLRELNISSLQITNEGVKNLQYLSNLEKLDLSYLKLLTDDALQYVASLPKLKVLKIRKCNFSTTALQSFPPCVSIEE